MYTYTSTTKVVNISVTSRVSLEGQCFEKLGNSISDRGISMCKGPVTGSSLVAPRAERRPVRNMLGDKVVVVRARSPTWGVFLAQERSLVLNLRASLTPS